MSRTVHLLRLWKENQEFLEKVADKSKCVSLLKECGENDLAESLSSHRKDSLQALLHCGKTFDKHFQKIIEKFNTDNNITTKKDLYKGLSLSRLKILMALVAQKKGLRIQPAYSSDLLLSDTPERFKRKFGSLLVVGFWFLGSVVEDSLSEDPDVNCGNPFGFVPGDLGLWWAGVVILDWIKYIKIKQMDKPCLQFFNDSSLNRSFRYNQNSAISHIEKPLMQFLVNSNLVNFNATIETVNSKLCKALFLKRKNTVIDMDRLARMTKELLMKQSANC